ncbi:MAG: NUDIX hydrolase [Hyphomicrobium sp.]
MLVLLMQHLRQYAALPFVEISGAIHVLLILSRGTGRWVIPKGWPKSSLAPHELAEREAFEEAGVKGRIGLAPIGTYSYTKRLHVFARARCAVEVFPLYADRQLLKWPERNSRELLWVAAGEAANLVDEPELSAILTSPELYAFTDQTRVEA